MKSVYYREIPKVERPIERAWFGLVHAGTDKETPVLVWRTSKKIIILGDNVAGGVGDCWSGPSYDGMIDKVTPIKNGEGITFFNSYS